MSMTQKDWVIAQINHEETDRVPYHLTFDPGSNIEDRLDVFYGSDSWRKLIDNAIYQLPLPSTGINLDLGWNHLLMIMEVFGERIYDHFLFQNQLYLSLLLMGIHFRLLTICSIKIGKKKCLKS